MQLYVRNMVCHRCKLVVKGELEKLGLHPLHVHLGEVVLEEKTITTEQRAALDTALQAVGFELIDDRRSRLIAQIKTFLIESVHSGDRPAPGRLSERLSRHLHHDYSYLSNLFSEVEGITIEHFLMSQKIEKVKELMLYDELSLTQIAFELDYSSPAHLSAQFKKLTGMTPSRFRELGAASRRPLDEAGNQK
jgi:AraC-like DNA-binding protein